MCKVTYPEHVCAAAARLSALGPLAFYRLTAAAIVCIKVRKAGALKWEAFERSVCSRVGLKRSGRNETIGGSSTQGALVSRGMHSVCIPGDAGMRSRLHHSAHAEVTACPHGGTVWNRVCGGREWWVPCLQPEAMLEVAVAGSSRLPCRF